MNAKCTLLLLAMCFSGCRTVTPHSWTREQPNWMWVDPRRGEVDYISTNCLTWVKPARLTDAVAMLAVESAVELKPYEFSMLAEDPIKGMPGERPFLIRGVTWSYPPWYTIVYWRPEASSLCVEQYTYNGEMYFPGEYASGANPVIAFLSKKPDSVIPRAIFGGDYIAAEMGKPYAWTERNAEPPAGGDAEDRAPDEQR